MVPFHSKTGIKQPIRHCRGRPLPKNSLCGHIKPAMTDFQKLIVAAIAMAIVLAVIKLFRVFDTCDGERFQRLRIQGRLCQLMRRRQNQTRKSAPSPSRKCWCSPDDRPYT